MYRGTCTQSSDRRLVFDICLWKSRNCLQGVENPAVELHQDFVRDLIKALMARPKPQEPSPIMLSIDQYLAARKQKLAGGEANADGGSLHSPDCTANHVGC